MRASGRFQPPISGELKWGLSGLPPADFILKSAKMVARIAEKSPAQQIVSLKTCKVYLGCD